MNRRKSLMLSILLAVAAVSAIVVLRTTHMPDSDYSLVVIALLAYAGLLSAWSTGVCLSRRTEGLGVALSLIPSWCIVINALVVGWIAWRFVGLIVAEHLSVAILSLCLWQAVPLILGYFDARRFTTSESAEVKED